LCDRRAVELKEQSSIRQDRGRLNLDATEPLEISNGQVQEEKKEWRYEEKDSVCSMHASQRNNDKDEHVRPQKKLIRPSTDGVKSQDASNQHQKTREGSVDIPETVAGGLRLETALDLPVDDMGCSVGDDDEKCETANDAMKSEHPLVADPAERSNGRMPGREPESV